jgi:hypothetical protein
MTQALYPHMNNKIIKIKKIIIILCHGRKEGGELCLWPDTLPGFSSWSCRVDNDHDAFNQ